MRKHVKGNVSWVGFTDWELEPFEQSDYKPERKVKRTSRGTMVRTKSEMLIEERLCFYYLENRYEQVLHIGEYKYAPDFTIKRADEKIFYWEHMGLVSDIGYYDRQLSKLRLFYGVGIVPWDKLLISFDDQNGDVDMNVSYR